MFVVCFDAGQVHVCAFSIAAAKSAGSVNAFEVHSCEGAVPVAGCWNGSNLWLALANGEVWKFDAKWEKSVVAVSSVMGAPVGLSFTAEHIVVCCQNKIGPIAAENLEIVAVINIHDVGNNQKVVALPEDDIIYLRSGKVYKYSHAGENTAAVLPSAPESAIDVAMVNAGVLAIATNTQICLYDLYALAIIREFALPTEVNVNKLVRTSRNLWVLKNSGEAVRLIEFPSVAGFLRGIAVPGVSAARFDGANLWIAAASDNINWKIFLCAV